MWSKKKEEEEGKGRRIMKISSNISRKGPSIDRSRLKGRRKRGAKIFEEAEV